MFSGFSGKKDFGSQQNELTQHITSGFGQSFGFLKSVQAIGSVDENIDKMTTFLNEKIDIMDDIPSSKQSSKSIPNPNKMKLFISLGVVGIDSKTDTEEREHLQLNNLNTAKFYKKSILDGMKQYFKEYANKLTTLKNMTIDDYKIPENTGYQVELKNKLKIFINKTKYFIFDVYMNHYVQYIYLLFAINIYKTTESYFTLNAEQQKQLNLMDKTNKLLSMTNQLQESDSVNFQKIKDAMNNLIEKTSDISKYNKPTQDEINKLKSLDKNASNQSGGNIQTVADSVIESIITKHNHFFEVYKDTRNAMPDYFNKINDLIMSKIDYLQELSNNIMNLEPQHFDIMKRTNDELNKLFSQPELQKNYKIDNNPLIKQVMAEKLSNDVNASINSTKQYAQTMQEETQNMIDTMVSPPLVEAKAPVVQPPVVKTPVVNAPVEKAPTQVTNTNQSGSTVVVGPEFPTSGGFVRAGTLFPKNNYKKSKFPLKQKSLL